VTGRSVGEPVSPGVGGDRVIGARGAPSGPPEEVRVEVPTGTGSYPVRIAPGLLRSLPTLLREHAAGHRYALISDSNVAPLHGEPLMRAMEAAGLPAILLTFPAGEAQKSREWWGRLTDRLLEEGFGRDGVVVALGGGVTGDLAGFVAATYMRGIPVVQCPTSLVAMIDASVGGKTGVDTPVGKNLVGAFHPPRVVVADPEVTATLPRQERAQGLAEAVKHGAILDRGYLDALRREAGTLLDGDPQATWRTVIRSVELKGDVVGRDEREGGLRRILNFGHTLAHALEQATGYAIPHGSAVALGMVLEARLGERLGVTAPGTAQLLAEVVQEMELPAVPPAGIDAEAMLAATRSDKKGEGGVVRYVLLRGAGEVDPGQGWVHAVPDREVLSLLRETSGA